MKFNLQRSGWDREDNTLKQYARKLKATCEPRYNSSGEPCGINYIVDVPSLEALLDISRQLEAPIILAQGAPWSIEIYDDYRE